MLLVLLNAMKVGPKARLVTEGKLRVLVPMPRDEAKGRSTGGRKRKTKTQEPKKQVRRGQNNKKAKRDEQPPEEYEKEAEAEAELVDEEGEEAEPAEL
jgi:hypothetical protein